MERKPIALTARVNIVYKGENRSAAVYDDGTAILDTGELINLTPEQYEKISERRKAVEREAAQAARERQAAREAAERKKAEHKARIKAIRQREEEEDLEDYSKSGHRYRSDLYSAQSTRPSIAKIAVATLVYPIR